jgi:hypothetical protein
MDASKKGKSLFGLFVPMMGEFSIIFLKQSHIFSTMSSLYHYVLFDM